jgi:hypothetical protein
MTVESENPVATNSELIVGKALIPRPKLCKLLPGVFAGETPLPFNSLSEKGLADESVRLALRDAIELSKTASPAPLDTGLRLEIGNPRIEDGSPEAYRLRVERDRITVTGRTADGVLMGLRTLAQLALDGPIPACEIADWPDMRLRATHLCYSHILETMPFNVPNFDALLEQIDRMAAVKQNAVLLELTAMFPFQKHANITCKIAFVPEQIARLRDRLRAQRMEVIPMVQCLGHAYEVLRHDQYAQYRELTTHTQQYCPANPQVIDLYMEFVDEYLAAFPGVKTFHLGGDESRMLGRCPRCAKKLTEVGESRLYVDHVAEVAGRVHAKGLAPLVWSDMLEHHPQAMSLLPKYLGIVYWNYDLPHWPRPYAVKTIMDQGFRTIAACGVRFGQTGTELSVYYREALRGIEALTNRVHQDGCREMITTNWMKGSPHENTEYGLTYAADLAWSVAGTREDFQRRYGKYAFGLNDLGICNVYEALSLILPYAETVGSHQVDKLDRLNVSGLKFPEKWGLYTDPNREPAIVLQLKDGLAAGRKAEAAIAACRMQATRGKRQLDLLDMSAKCIQAKARLALALHVGKALEQNSKAETEVLLKWCAHLPATIGAWDAAKDDHYKKLVSSGFEPCVQLLSDMFFEPAEREFLVQLGDRIAAKVRPGKKPEELAIPFLDNPGPPYERGFRHGSVFRTEIVRAIATRCGDQKTHTSTQRSMVKKRMFHYVSERCPDVAEELRGIADGSGQLLEDIQWLNCFNAIKSVQANCTSVVVGDAAGHLVLGKTSDIDPKQRKEMLIRRVRYKDVDFYVVGWFGTVWTEMALTRAGLALGANSAPAMPKQSGTGLPQHLGLYPILFRAATVREAVAELATLDFAGKGLVIGLADARGAGAMVEKTGTAQGVRWMEGTAILGVNWFQTAGMCEFRSASAYDIERIDYFAGWAGGKPQENVVAAVKQLLALPTFCRTGNPYFTEASSIALPQTRTYHVTGQPPSEDLYAIYRFEDD